MCSTPTVAGRVTTKVDLTVLQLLRNVDIPLRMYWLEKVITMVDWCEGKMYFPNGIHFALLGEASSIRSLKIMLLIQSLHVRGWEKTKNGNINNQIYIIKSPEF